MQDTLPLDSVEKWIVKNKPIEYTYPSLIQHVEDIAFKVIHPGLPKRAYSNAKLKIVGDEDGAKLVYANPLRRVFSAIF